MTRYYVDVMRTLALEAMHRTCNGEDSNAQLILIGLCAQAIEGDKKATEVLKNHGIHPKVDTYFRD
jgi:hypothetical protein